MPMYNRGGGCLDTGKIGRVKILRQQLMLPGEIVKSRVTGDVRLTPLRERDTLRIHARIDAFLTPYRWLWNQLPAYLAEGPATTRTWPTTTLAPGSDNSGPTYSDLGIGSSGYGPVLSGFLQAPLRIYNEYYKWPEDADATAWRSDGLKAVNLAHSWTRLQAYDGINDADAELTTVQSGAREKFDVRTLSELMGRYRQRVSQEFIAHGRYMDLLREQWDANGSREADQVPRRLRGAEVGVNPQNLRATDGDSLGATASFYNFGVDHPFGTIVAPEHCILTYVMLIRFRPMAEDEINPMAVLNSRSWAEMAGDPGMLATMRPQPVDERDIANSTTTTLRGYLPAGWQWRAMWNNVGRRIDDRDSFPVIRSVIGQSATALRDASRVGNPFLSQSLGDYQINLNFSESVDSPIPGPRSSLFAGAGDAGRGSAYPYPGPKKVV